MNISRSQLSKLIESYLYEQESEKKEDDQEKSDSKNFEFDLELSSKITGDASGKPQQFNVQFFEDTDGNLNYKVNGNVVKKDKLSFITLAGYGLLGGNDDISGKLEAIIKNPDHGDKSLANYSKDRIAQIVTQKKDTSREPFSTDNLKKALGL